MAYLPVTQQQPQQNTSSMPLLAFRHSSACAPVQYEPDSAPALALNATIERTEKRFAKYANQNLLCGSDGLPHLISDPGLALRFGHAGETLVRPIPVFMKT